MPDKDKGALSRIIYIRGNITEDSSKEVEQNLLDLILQDNEDEKLIKNFNRKPIHIFLSSYGGTVYNMFSIIDIMNASKTPIYTYCNGYAMSAVAIIFMAGHKRFCFKHSTIMLHQVMCGASGELKFVMDRVDEFNRVNELVCDFIVNNSKIERSKLEEIKDKKLDWFIDSEEALKLGIADEIIYKLEI